jgi:hypothetical protein
VLGWRGQHAPQQLAVAGLDHCLIAQREAGGGDPLGELVTHHLELLEASYAWLGKRGGDRSVEVEPREGLDGKAGELVLEPAYLTAQLSPCEALIASHAQC